MGERVTVEGTVENVIFHNEENGYTVLLLTVEGEEEPVTVVGCIPCAAAGEGMTVTGVWSVHPVHGSQLTAESVERGCPEREEDMIAYLSSGILQGYWSRHRTAAGGALRRGHPAGHRAGAGAPAVHQGHHRPEGEGAVRRFPDALTACAS